MEERKARTEIIKVWLVVLLYQINSLKGENFQANKRFTGLSEFLVESWRDWVKRK